MADAPVAAAANVEAKKEEDPAVRKKRLRDKKFKNVLKAVESLSKLKGLNENQVNFITAEIQKALDLAKKKLTAKKEEVKASELPSIQPYFA